jgi:hypothetical protein
MNLKEFKQAFFGSDAQYEALTDKDKNANRFMINRMIATRYPLISNFVNSIGTDGAVVVDTLRKFCKERGISNLPYVPTKKNTDKKKFDWYPKNKEILKRYCNHHQIALKEFDERLKWNPIETKNEFTDFEKIFK